MTAYTTMPVLPDKQRRVRREQLNALGVPTHVPAAPVRAHVTELHDMGMDFAMIARSAGVSDTMIRTLHSGVYNTVRFDCGRAVMQATHKPDPRTVWVLAIGAQRRVESLGLMGWSQGYIGGRLGVSQAAVSEMFTWADHRTGERRRRVLIRWERWKQVADLYDELCMKRGPFQGAAKKAAAAGAFFPLEWEDLDIDDPRVTPKRVRYKRERSAGDRSDSPALTAARRERVAELTAAGLSISQIAERLCVTQRTVVRDRRTFQQVAS